MPGRAAAGGDLGGSGVSLDESVCGEGRGSCGGGGDGEETLMNGSVLGFYDFMNVCFLILYDTMGYEGMVFSRLEE